MLIEDKRWLKLSYKRHYRGTYGSIEVEMSGKVRNNRELGAVKKR